MIYEKAWLSHPPNNISNKHSLNRLCTKNNEHHHNQIHRKLNNIAIHKIKWIPSIPRRYHQPNTLPRSWTNQHHSQALNTRITLPTSTRHLHRVATRTRQNQPSHLLLKLKCGLPIIEHFLFKCSFALWPEDAKAHSQLGWGMPWMSVHVC